VATPLDETQEGEPRSGDDVAIDATGEAKEDGEVAADGETKETEVPEETKEYTLAEWKKLEDVKRMVPNFNLRKPGEGEDNAQWKKTFLLKKIKADDDDDYEEVEVDEGIRHGRVKKVLDIEINFKDENRDMRRGRGRGGPRGGRGAPGSGRGRGERDSGDRPERPDRGDRPDRVDRGGGRGGFRRRDGKEQAAPKVDDFNDFPSLAAP